MTPFCDETSTALILRFLPLDELVINASKVSKTFRKIILCNNEVWKYSYAYTFNLNPHELDNKHNWNDISTTRYILSLAMNPDVVFSTVFPAFNLSYLSETDLQKIYRMKLDINGVYQHLLWTYHCKKELKLLFEKKNLTIEFPAERQQEEDEDEDEDEEYEEDERDEKEDNEENKEGREQKSIDLNFKESKKVKKDNKAKNDERVAAEVSHHYNKIKESHLDGLSKIEKYSNSVYLLSHNRSSNANTTNIWRQVECKFVVYNNKGEPNLFEYNHEWSEASGGLGYFFDTKINLKFNHSFVCGMKVSRKNWRQPSTPFVNKDTLLMAKEAVLGSEASVVSYEAFLAFLCTIGMSNDVHKHGICDFLFEFNISVPFKKILSKIANENWNTAKYKRPTTSLPDIELPSWFSFFSPFSLSSQGQLICEEDPTDEDTKYLFGKSVKNMKEDQIHVKDWKSPKPLIVPTSPYNLLQIKDSVRIARFRLAALDFLDTSLSEGEENGTEPNRGGDDLLKQIIQGPNWMVPVKCARSSTLYYQDNQRAEFAQFIINSPIQGATSSYFTFKHLYTNSKFPTEDEDFLLELHFNGFLILEAKDLGNDDDEEEKEEEQQGDHKEEEEENRKRRKIEKDLVSNANSLAEEYKEKMASQFSLLKKALFGAQDAPVSLERCMWFLCTIGRCARDWKGDTVLYTPQSQRVAFSIKQFLKRHNGIWNM